MNAAEELELRATLTRLKEEHRDLDAAITSLEEVAARDLIRIQRLKKRKLALKDQINRIEEMLIPDIIA